jgi:hypothetical protein
MVYFILLIYTIRFASNIFGSSCLLSKVSVTLDHFCSHVYHDVINMPSKEVMKAYNVLSVLCRVVSFVNCK